MDANKVKDVTGEYQWPAHGKPWKKILLLIEVKHNNLENGQRLASLVPNAQARFILASEKDVFTNEYGDISLSWTSDIRKQLVLDAFKLL